MKVIHIKSGQSYEAAKLLPDNIGQLAAICAAQDYRHKLVATGDESGAIYTAPGDYKMFAPWGHWVVYTTDFFTGFVFMPHSVFRESFTPADAVAAAEPAPAKPEESFAIVNGRRHEVGNKSVDARRVLSADKVFIQALALWVRDNGGHAFTDEKGIMISNPSGLVSVEVGDWIIKDVGGIFYPCKPDVFEEMYKREVDRLKSPDTTKPAEPAGEVVRTESGAVVDPSKPDVYLVRDEGGKFSEVPQAPAEDRSQPNPDYRPVEPSPSKFSQLAAEVLEDQVRHHPLYLEMRALKDGAYLERNRVVAAFARMAMTHGWPVAILKTNIDGWDPEWQQCIFIETPFGQVSWHFHDNERTLFPNTMVGTGAIWDGHTTDEKYRRLDVLVGTFSIPRTIGWAVNRMLAGKKVRRAGWNGKGMYLWLLPEAMVPVDWCKEPHLRELAENNPDGSRTMHCLPSIRMKTADGKVLTGWLASQTDLLASDWEEVL